MKKDNIHLKITFYVPDKLSLGLLYIAIFLNGYFTLAVLNNMGYSGRVMTVSLYGIVYTLLMFSLGSDIKIYQNKANIYIFILSVIQILRVINIPLDTVSFMIYFSLICSGMIGILTSLFSSKKIKAREKLLKSMTEENNNAEYID